MIANPIAEQVRQPGFRFRLQAERISLHFRCPARTSRGALLGRTVFRVRAVAKHGAGYGDCCTMPGLSPEEGADYEARLLEACRRAEMQGGLEPGQFAESPSIRFGLECALLAASRPCAPRWDTPFARGEAGLAIHHLIWMDQAEAMLACMEGGVARGFRCIKFKVGALPFGQEIALLREARARFPGVELRVDANGAFSPGDALRRLEALADAGAACIEQPLRPGQWRETAALCRLSPLPVALDEELIAATCRVERIRLLDALHPWGLVLKPSLHGGLSGAEEWASLAEERGIRWWANSALESHVGLTALAEWCALRAPNTLHGLGTGLLFADDEPFPVCLQGCRLAYLSQRRA